MWENSLVRTRSEKGGAYVAYVLEWARPDGNRVLGNGSHHSQYSGGGLYLAHR